MCRLVLERFGPGADNIVVGDRLDTDGAFAAALGYRFALVLSGVTQAEDIPPDDPPDLVAADAVEAIGRLTSFGGRPA
jgi:ribonucleotide monophosphatase NagD (HAD superfamily)